MMTRELNELPELNNGLNPVELKSMIFRLNLVSLIMHNEINNGIDIFEKPVSMFDAYIYVCFSVIERPDLMYLYIILVNT